MPHKSWDEIKFKAFWQNNQDLFEEMKKAVWDCNYEKVARLVYNESEKRAKARAKAVQDLRNDL